MIEPRSTRPDDNRWASAWLTALLSASAAAAVGYWAWRGLGRADTEAMESPLILAVARQLTASPRELYGPYGGSNPLVLIHAPLYYRVAALLAWPMARAGVAPADAARVAGRLISALGLLATMAAAHRLGRLGGLPRRAGWWSALLVAASPVLGAQPFAVRPDMAGVALQTWGVALALGPGSWRRLALASVLFGASACVKQHLLAGWAVCAALAVWRGRLRDASWVVVPGLAVAGLVYGAEWLATDGRVWDAAFVAASQVGRVHPAKRHASRILFMGVVGRSAGTFALLASAGLVAAGRRPGTIRWLATAAGLIVVGAVVAMLAVHAMVENPETATLRFLVIVLAAVVALPSAAIVLRARSPARGVDAALAACLAAEIGLIALLFRSTSGAWFNYAIPAAVFAATLAGRAMAMALEARVPAVAASPAILAAAAVVVTSLYEVHIARWDAAVARALMGELDANIRTPRESRFVVGRPGLNRLDGRLDLVYDDWLYPVFESIGQAEPRTEWLGRALLSSSVRAVVNNHDGPEIRGTGIDLRVLGYRHGFRAEPDAYVWVR